MSAYPIQGVFVCVGVDVLLMMGTNLLFAVPNIGWRLILAATVDAGYGILCQMSGYENLHWIGWRILFLAVLSQAAFGIDRTSWKRGGVFLMASIAVCGLSLGIFSGESGIVILSFSVLLLLLIALWGKTGMKQAYVPLSIHYNGNILSLTALRDTGNMLRDPISGERIFLISARAAQELMGFSIHQLKDPLQTLLKYPEDGLRLIPYRTIGCSSGMLLGKRFPKTMIGTKEVKAVIAFVPEGLGEGQRFQALVSG